MDRRVAVLGSKSYTNRALILAALTQGPVYLHNPLFCDDTEAMIDCLQMLGIAIERKSDLLIVHGDISQVREGKYQLFARSSGTTMRFMLALLCLVPGLKTISGSRRLNERPMEDLVCALRQLGAKIEDKQILSSSLFGKSVQLQGDISSQFCSALLMIAPYLPDGLTISTLGNKISKPYIDMTIGCMREWGVEVFSQEGVYFVAPRQQYRMTNYFIEGDFSSASYFFAIGALTKSKVTVANVNPFSLQADRRFLTILENMGNPIHYAAREICIEGRQLSAIEVDMEDCPDQVMTLAVLAAFAPGVTKISHIRSLRVKECNRVQAVRCELAKMGIRTEETLDTLTIYGGKPHAAEIDTYDDHRIAMAFAVAKTLLPDMVIRNPEVVNKTFPTFWEVL